MNRRKENKKIRREGRGKMEQMEERESEKGRNGIH